MPRLHTDRLYEGELRKIREMLLMMGAKVEEMLSQAMRALIERDTELADRTLYIDRQINRLEMEVDDRKRSSSATPRSTPTTARSFASSSPT